MKFLSKAVGISLFWISWPLQWLYLKLLPDRTRVFIVFENKVLLMKPFMGPSKWMLPGGGLKRNETPEECAVREVKEEVGVDIVETQLKRLGKRSFINKGLPYKSINYAVELSEKPNIKASWYEVRSYRWTSLDSLDSDDIAKEVKFNAKRFTPHEQETLL